MYKQIIKKYISSLTKEDIINFINKNNYNVNNNEIEVIYYYIKNHWEEIFDNDQKIWNKIKADVSPNTYMELIKLYNKYKKLI